VAPGPAGATLVPDLATAIPSVSVDTTQYPFTLHSGVRFSDGPLLRAHDVRASFERAMLEDPGDIQGSPLAKIRGASACLADGATTCDLSTGIEINDKQGTVRFLLTSPDPQFLGSLTTGQATIVPSWTPVTPGADLATHHPIVVGTGPYKVSRFVWPKFVVLTRNKYFRPWAPAAQPAGYPDRIVIEATHKSPQNLIDLEQHRIDVLDDQTLTPAQVQEAISGHDVVKRDEGGVALRFAFLNESLPPFKNVLARRAVNYAIDRAAMIRIRQSAQNLQPTCQVLPPGVTGYRPFCPYTVNADDSGVWKAPDLRRAKALVRLSGTENERVVVARPPKSKKDEPSAAYLVQVLHQIGYRRAELGPKFPTFLDYVSDIFQGRAQIAPLGFGSTPDGGGDISPWICSYIQNDPGRYCNEHVDALYNRGVKLALTSPADADNIWAAADRTLTRDAAILPVWTESNYALLSTDVGDWTANFNGGVLLSQLWVK
jgi:peptide/nickel transport system substrate-binding protein